MIDHVTDDLNDTNKWNYKERKHFFNVAARIDVSTFSARQTTVDSNKSVHATDYVWLQMPRCNQFVNKRRQTQ